MNDPLEKFKLLVKVAYYKEALEKIANMEPHWLGRTRNEHHMQEIARKVLDDVEKELPKGIFK